MTTGHRGLRLNKIKRKRLRGTQALLRHRKPIKSLIEVKIQPRSNRKAGGYTDNWHRSDCTGERTAVEDDMVAMEHKVEMTAFRTQVTGVVG